MSPYCLKHRFRLCQNFIVPESQYLIPLCFKPLIPIDIFLFSRLQSMLSAVQFNDNFLFKANKIDNVFSYGLLSPEFESAQMFGL